MFYYDAFFAATTNGTANTLSTHLRMATAAAVPARVVGLYATPRGTSAGGGGLRIIRAGTIGTGGTGVTVGKRDPDNPTATLTVNHTPTAGGSPLVHLSVGFSQTGGQGGWVALEPDHAFKMKANAGANGNLEIGSFAAGTNVPVDITMEFLEIP